MCEDGGATRNRPTGISPLTKVRRLALVDDHLLQLSLVGGPLQYFLVDGVGRDQAIHHNRFGLTDAVTAVLSLQVCLRVLTEEQNTLSNNFGKSGFIVRR